MCRGGCPRPPRRRRDQRSANGPSADEIDILAVEHPSQPGPEPLDIDELASTWIELEQYVLNQVLGVGHAAGEAPGQPIEVLHLRAQQILKLRRGGPASAEAQNWRHKSSYTSARPKRFPPQPGRLWRRATVDRRRGTAS